MALLSGTLFASGAVRVRQAAASGGETRFEARFLARACAPHRARG